MADDVAGSLIDALAGEGEHVDDGQFTLDAAAAYRKLREHQLVDPHGYLLLLVEAAWLAADDPSRGRVRIDVGATTKVEIVGLALEPESLRELFAAVWGRLSELDGDALRRARILQLLGLAANNALALEPSHLIVEASGADGRTTRVRVGPDATLTLEDAKPDQPGTIRFELHGKGLGRSRCEAERALVEQRCRFTRLEVVLDGEQVSRGPECDVVTADLMTGKLASSPVNLRGQAIGLVAHARDYFEPPTTWFVNRGVAVRDPGSDLAQGLHAIIEVDLPMDLSRKALLDTPDLEAIRFAIRAARGRVPSPSPPAKATEASNNGAVVALVAVILLLTVGIAVFMVMRESNSRTNADAATDILVRCKRGEPDACKVLVEGAPTNPVDRQRALRFACNASQIDSCEELTSPEYRELEAGVPLEDRRAGLELLCRRSNKHCVEAAGLAINPARRTELLEIGCAAQDGPACRLLEVAQ